MNAKLKARIDAFQMQRLTNALHAGYGRRDAMRASGARMVDIAEAAGVTTATLNNWVRGRTVPNVARLTRLAAYIGASLDDIVDEPVAK